MIPTQTIEAIRERVDIVDVIGQYVSLRRSGQNFKGLCPFHSERTPSFNVHPGKRTFRCFGCNIGGDVFSFVARIERIDFFGAVKLLASEVGVELHSGPVSRRMRAQQRKERRLALAVERYAALERGTLCEYAGRVRAIDRLEAFAAFCLKDSFRARLDDSNELAEFWWSALARVYAARWHALAAWLLIAFGGEDERQRFVLYSGERPGLIASVLDAGGVVDDRQHWRELVA